MRYTLFGQHTGLRVSTLVLGTGMFGTKWGHGADPTESRRMFDGYLEAGGNFLDTADTYQFGESESLLGEFVHATREDLILASKYSLSASPHGNLVETGNKLSPTTMNDTATTVRIPMKIDGSVALVTGATNRGPRRRGGLAPGRFGIGSAVKQAVHQIGAVLGVAQYKEGRTL